MSRLVLCLCLLLAACGPEATPLPAFIVPTETPAPTPTTAPLPVLALEANAVGRVEDLSLLQASMQVVALAAPAQDSDLGSAYDVIAGYGHEAGWTLSPVVPRVSLVVNPRRAPLIEPTIAEVLRRSLDPERLFQMIGIPGAQPEATIERSASELRAVLANAGWPDGFDVTLLHSPLPGVPAVAGQLRELGIEAALMQRSTGDMAATLEAGEADLALVLWTNDTERQGWVDLAGAENVLDLFRLPIRYRAIDGLTITFTPGGWPIAAR